MITRKIARHTLHYFLGDEGYSGGYFSDHLFQLMAHADSKKLTQIAEGFPAEVAAFEMARKSDNGIESLRIIATGEMKSVKFTVVGAN